MLRSSASRLSLRISAKPAFRAFTTARERTCRTSTPASRFVPLLKPDFRQFSASATRLSTLSKTCPSCSSPLPTPLPACPRCSFITRLPPSATYYDIFDISKDDNAFDLDPRLLKDRFRDLQRVVHPDKWSGKAPAVQAAAAELSGIVNKAYGTLTNPYTRAEYLLQLEGITVGESDSLEDPALIMEVMEIREELESAETREEVERLRRENLSKIDEAVAALSASVASKEWASVKESTIRLKYLQGIDLAAEAWPAQPFDH